MFSEHKKLRNEEKHFIKNHKTLYNIRTDTRISNYRVASLLKTADSDCHQTSYKYINQFRKKVYSMQSSCNEFKYDVVMKSVFLCVIYYIRY